MKTKTIKLEVDISNNNMYCVEIFNNPELSEYCKNVLSNNNIFSANYVARQKACPFLQSHTNDYCLIEFWTNDFDAIQTFVDYLNSNEERM